MDEPRTCPRCGMPVAENTRGRPRIWCSDDCRRRGLDEGIQVREVVREKQVRVPERISVDRQITRILDDPDATEQLLRALVHRWRHRGPETDAAAHRALAPTVLELWQAFHAPVDPESANNPPPRVPTPAAEQRAAVERVLSSPRSIREVLIRVRDMRDAGQLSGGAAAPVHNGIAYLFGR
ncbi:hypothetical protein IU501_35390 [Nocardia otitidiscaviarum]|uniref:hypothetical protein n=1 Tax=Nocardia otitidiscaviarum TaxID=1823 RepID=UPI0018956C54|nr:hypothetical protein [Nocardia otitidiscaviarum]MBF6138259.1 hypothetical protein [Nocardia otitidiscaviarum]